MRKQRNMAQMKEQELNAMEMSNLSDGEFKTLFIKMLK